MLITPAVSLSYPALVIFQEAEHELANLLCSGKLSENDIIGEYRALQLASGWPTGIKMLLDAGADMTSPGKGKEVDQYDGGFRFAG